MNSSGSINNKSTKIKINPLNFIATYSKNNLSESKKNKINQENISRSQLNSMRFLTTFNDSSFESLKLHIIRKPYKIFCPMRTKIKKIRNNIELSLNNYYRKIIKNHLFLKDINTKIDSSRENYKIPKIKNNSILKSTFDGSKSIQNSQSKNIILNTERIPKTKDFTNINLSNISKINKYDKYNIFSYNSNKGLSNNNSTSNNTKIIMAYNNYKPLRFLAFNQGYKNLTNLETCINNFSNEIKNLTREKYMNYCLKEQEANVKASNESNHENYIMEIYKKNENKTLFDIFHKDYNTYYNRIKKKEEKDTDKISLLNWEIISYKNEVNRLNIKKDKLLARLNKYVKMKQFLIAMRNYSLDKKDDSWMFEKSNSKNVDYKMLIKERRIKEEENENSNKNKNRRRGSVDLQNLGKFKEIKLKEDRRQKGAKKLKRLNSSKDKNPLLNSEMKEIATILNNHIANLLIYQNQLRIDLEPLKEEFDNLYKSSIGNNEKKNKIIQLKYLILPEKKRIAKQRNEFLANTLINIKEIMCNFSKYNKMNKLINEKLNCIYKLLLDNEIIKSNQDKSLNEPSISEQNFFFLKNIEYCLDLLIRKKKYIIKEYPILYNDIVKNINDEIKVKALKAQKRIDLNKGVKKLNEIINKMGKASILNRRKDYYQYGYKKEKKKVKIKKVDSYDELRYSYDINNEENN